MSIIGDNIRKRRLELELSQEQLAKLIGYSSRSSVNKIELGQTDINQTKVEAFAKALHTTPAALLGISELLRISEEDNSDAEEDQSTRTARRLAPAELVNISMQLNEPGNRALVEYGHFLESKDEYKITDKERRFRLVQSPMEIEAPAPIIELRHYFFAPAAGYASPVEGEDYEMVALPEDAPRDADFCVDIAGDSMEPYIHDGQRVYVKRDVSLLQFDPGIFYYAGDTYCKQINEDYSGGINLLSANPKREDANIHIPKDQLQYLVCYGKVILPHKLPAPDYIRRK